MTEKKIRFIKISDERIAEALCDGGFLCTKERVAAVDGEGRCVDKTLYCFAKSKKLERAMKKFAKESEVCCGVSVSETLLRF